MASEGLPRSAKLSGAQAFRKLLRAKHSARGDRFVVQVLANGGGRARLGVVVGKRLAPRAVDRSYLKRIVRESFRVRRSQLTGFDVLVRFSRPVSRSESAVAREELHALFSAVIR